MVVVCPSKSKMEMAWFLGLLGINIMSDISKIHSHTETMPYFVFAFFRMYTWTNMHKTIIITSKYFKFNWNKTFPFEELLIMRCYFPEEYHVHLVTLHLSLTWSIKDRLYFFPELRRSQAHNIHLAPPESCYGTIFFM